MDSASLPPAALAVARFPHLNAQYGGVIALQAARIAERTRLFVPRAGIVAGLDERLRSLGGGVVAIEGPRGAGATTLLCHLAATRPFAFWLPEEGGGLAALCAQLIALRDLPAPLVPPTVASDAGALARLLAEVGAGTETAGPVVLLLGRPAAPDAVPREERFPGALPAGIVAVVACEPGEQLPGGLAPAERIVLPAAGAELDEELVGFALALGLPEKASRAIAARSRGSFLYVRLAAGLIASRHGRRSLPGGLEALHRAWWGGLAESDRALLRVVAAAGEPIDLEVAAAAAGLPLSKAEETAARYPALLKRSGALARIYHPATTAFIGRQSGGLARQHAALAAVARERSGGQLARLDWDAGGYFSRQLARHTALADSATRHALAPPLTGRGWIFAQERRTGAHALGATDVAWLMAVAAREGPPLRIVRDAVLGGTLTLLARAMPPDAPAEALTTALERGQPREPTLRRIRAMVDQLPDGRDKAQALRRLGEVCFAVRMRASAMRMLSEALDLEAPGPPRSWRDEREETLMAFARAATTLGAPDMALGITTRIVHPERRGMIETEVVRWLLERGQRTRAEEVAYAIGHAGNHEWAMAEVAVGHAHAADFERAGVVLGTLRTETAVAWVSAEIACDTARRGNPRAVDRVALLPNPVLRDRALVQVALALAQSGMAESALDVARLVMDAETRARGMVDLALASEPLAADALDEASLAAALITGEEQASVVVALAAAQAAVGRPDDALRTAELLPAGEGRDRALSRIAVALARTGGFARAQAVAEEIYDDDERDWGIDELARLLGASGAWAAAFALAGRVAADEQRARTEADLAIGWARAGEPLAAHGRATGITAAAERLRAQIVIAEALVEVGAQAVITETLAGIEAPEARARYQAAVAGALARQGSVDEARHMAGGIAQPIERARVLVAVAQAAAGDGTRGQEALGAALQAVAALGRREVFQCLGWAAGALAAIGGPELLLASSGALDEVDGWWS
jgi:tetratricopeptide (TPR) repeat protein